MVDGQRRHAHRADGRSLAAGHAARFRVASHSTERSRRPGPSPRRLWANGRQLGWDGTGRHASCARKASVTYPRRIPANPRRQTMTQETRAFQAEVSRLLEIVAHSLYSEKEIFLRELISNASDACDRLRYAALTEPELTEGESNFSVIIVPDKSARTLTVIDNGIGMN